MRNFKVNYIGKISVRKEGMFIELDPEYIPALQELAGFSHLNIIWWFSEFDSEEARSVLEVPKPYKNAPDIMGTFATRSPVRPNPIALTTVQIIHINYEKGSIQIPYIDAYDGSPLLDIKPYTPSLDRVENPGVPGWCSHWPKSIEESGNFDWDSEFTFSPQ